MFEKEISETQSGFRKGIGTREGIFNIRAIIDKMLAVNKKLYICYIDYEKAFDRVYHNKLIQVIEKSGMDGKDRRLIQNLYYEQSASIQFGEEQSETFNIKRGVRQGCVLSPKLFNLYTEEIFNEIENLQGINIGGRNMTNLRFADDTVLMAESEEALQEIVDRIKVISLEHGLKMNIKKTKTMIVRKNIKDGSKIIIKVDGQNLEQVDKYVYLGVLITEDGRCEKEIKRRIEIARNNFMGMKNLLTSRKMTITTKKRLIRCYILSTFLYAAETWTINKESWKKIESFEMWLLRKMMRIPYTEHKTNIEVLQLTKSKRTLKTEILNRKAQYFGHLIRKGRLQRILLDGKVEGKRGRGRPRRIWFSDIRDGTGKNYSDCVRMVQKRRTLQWIAADEQNVRATNR